MIIAALALGAASLSAQELTNFAFFGMKPVISPEVKNDSVTFRLKAEYATIVKISGSWMDGWGATEDMKRNSDLVWEYKMPLPSPEIYTYNFVVDGVPVNDPQNYMVQRDGTRYLNMLLVDGERTENYRETAHCGTVSYRWYDSKILGLNRRLTVYTPYGYEAGKGKYPVLYLLHGAGGDEEAWSSMGHAAQILDNLIEKGLAKPMIVVMPNGNPNQQAACTMGLPTTEMDWRNPANRDLYVKSLVTEIVPFIESNFRAAKGKANRAIAGLSMGGGHTLAASNMYPGTFDYICPLSMGAQHTPELDAQLQAVKKAGYRLYFVACGNTDFLFKSAQDLDEALTANGLEHTFFVSDGGHVWANWRLYLNTFAPLLFK